MNSWRAARQAGVRLYLTSDGRVRMKPGGLSPHELAALRVHRDTIVAEWLWSLPDVPPVIEWNDHVAERVIAFGVELMAGPGLDPAGDGSAAANAALALDAAVQARNLAGVAGAVRAWVLAVSALSRSPISVAATS